MLAAALIAAFLPLSPRAAEIPEAVLEKGLREHFGASRKDLDLRPEMWPVDLPIPAAEAVLEDPLSFPELARKVEYGMREPRGLAGLFAAATDILGEKARPIPPPSNDFVRELAEAGLPAEVVAVVYRLDTEMLGASVRVREASASIPDELFDKARADVFTSLGGAEKFNGVLDRRLRSFDRAGMLDAARNLSEAVDALLPALGKIALMSPRFKRRSWQRPYGLLTIAGAGDDSYDAQTLEKTALLLDLGGKNSYRGPAAAAKSGEVKLVIDLGSDVVIDSTGPTASGERGVGLLYMPEPGKKKLKAGDVSWGAGLFGVGGALLRGDVSLEGGRFSEGAGAFGTGVLDVLDSSGMVISAAQAGQGFGFTEGAGLFKSAGSGARLDCGLKGNPHYFDPSSSESFCQGFGLGPRAYAGGGVGLALVDGDSVSMTSNFFAQGSAYWRGLGALVIRGDDAHLKARRYTQGAGTHMAAGLLDIKGNRAQLITTVSGPALGWDLAAGITLIEGDDALIAVESGGALADVNGHSLMLVRGDRARVASSDWSMARFSRNGPSWSLNLFEGQDDRISVPVGSELVPGRFVYHHTPWGVSAGVSLDPKLRREPEKWPDVSAKVSAADEDKKLEDALEAERRMDARARLKALVTRAAGVDDDVLGTQARRAIMELSDSEVPDLVGLLNARDFDEMLMLRPMLAARGRIAAAALAERAKTATGVDAARVAAQLGYGPVAQALPALSALLDRGDALSGSAAAGALGGLLSRETGAVPGRAFRLVAAGNAATYEDFAKGVGGMDAAQAMALLGLLPDATAAERVSVMDQVHHPVALTEAAKQALWAVLSRRSVEVRRKIYGPESASVENGTIPGRTVLRRILERRPPLDTELSAIVALGAIGNQRDAGLISERLAAPSALIAEAAANALARAGPAGLPQLDLAAHSKNERMKRLAITGYAQSSAADACARLAEAMRDLGTRDLAISGVFMLPAEQRNASAPLKEELEKLAPQDPQAAAALALWPEP